MNIGATPAPTNAFNRDAMARFGMGDNMSATVMPNTNVPATAAPAMSGVSQTSQAGPASQTTATSTAALSQNLAATDTTVYLDNVLGLPAAGFIKVDKTV